MKYFVPPNTKLQKLKLWLFCFRSSLLKLVTNYWVAWTRLNLYDYRYFQPKIRRCVNIWDTRCKWSFSGLKNCKPRVITAQILKVSKSWKQFMASSILPINEWNSLSWASFLVRIVSFIHFWENWRHHVNCFRDLLTLMYTWSHFWRFFFINFERDIGLIFCFCKWS